MVAFPFSVLFYCGGKLVMLWDPFSVQQTTAGKKDLIDPGSREVTNIEGALRMNE